MSSLWAVDALFEMARVGVDGVNMHTYPGATYQMFTFTQQGGKWRTTVKPEYYGLMLFAQAAPAGSRLVGTSAKNARGIVTWATRGTDGHTRVVLINQSLNRRAVALNGGSAASSSATLTRLQAPRLSSTSGVTLGGQHFGTTTGTLTGRSNASSVAAQGSRYVFSLPAHSAVLVTY